MESISDAIREYTALVSQQDTNLAAGVAGVDNAVQNRSMTFPIGTRVLDLVTGEQGTVVNGKRENVVIPLTANSGS